MKTASIGDPTRPAKCAPAPARAEVRGGTIWGGFSRDPWAPALGSLGFLDAKRDARGPGARLICRRWPRRRRSARRPPRPFRRPVGLKPRASKKISTTSSWARRLDDVLPCWSAWPFAADERTPLFAAIFLLEPGSIANRAPRARSRTRFFFQRAGRSRPSGYGGHVSRHPVRPTSPVGGFEAADWDLWAVAPRDGHNLSRAFAKPSARVAVSPTKNRAGRGRDGPCRT